MNRGLLREKILNSSSTELGHSRRVWEIMEIGIEDGKRSRGKSRPRMGYIADIM